MSEKLDLYTSKLSKMIQAETVSSFSEPDLDKFKHFRSLLKDLFPLVFKTCEMEEFDGSLLLKWKGVSSDKPSLLMNHYDVVEATGEWSHPAFSGEVVDGKLYGRGTLDDKGPLFAMLQGIEEMIESGFTPKNDIYIETGRNEETDGRGADAISRALEERGIRIDFVLDEGGEIMYDPLGGADGTFAVVGLGEKCTVDLKFTARSAGGHASTPGKNTPLVRLGKFMAEVDSKDLFKKSLSPVIKNMFKDMAPTVKGPLGFVFAHPTFFGPILKTVMPKVSPAAKALLQTTIAFTMAKGSDGDNVLPQEAYVIANMRTSHHEGLEHSIAAVKKIADKYGLETEVVSEPFESPLSDVNSEQYKLLKNIIKESFPNVIPTTYIMNGASDSKYFSRVSDNVFRFAPFTIDGQQLSSIHGLDENVNIDTLEPAVNFYRNLIKEL